MIIAQIITIGILGFCIGYGICAIVANYVSNKEDDK